MTIKKIIIVLVHAFIGWALCAATIGVGLTVTTLGNAFVIHAVGTPLFFAFVSLVCVNKLNYTTPLQTVAIFLAIVLAVDFFIGTAQMRSDIIASDVLEKGS